MTKLQPLRLIPCQVKAGGTTYTGLFPSTSAAVIDAMCRFPNCDRIVARRTSQ